MNVSKNLNQEEELLSMLEEMQDQIEDLQSQLSEARQKLSETSSQNSKLMSEIQKKSEKIVSLNEQIEKLNASDLILKKNEELQKLNASLKAEMEKTKSDAKAQVEAVRKRYELEETKICDKRKELDGRENQISQKEESLDFYIRDKAAAMYAEIKQRMEADYKNEVWKSKIVYDEKQRRLSYKYLMKTIRYGGAFFLSLIYGILITLFQIIQEPMIRNDFMDVVGVIVNGTKNIYEGTATTGLFVARLGNMIPNEIVATIVHWLLLILVLLIVLGGLAALIIFGVKKYVTLICESQNDKITAIVGLVILAVGLFFGKGIKSIMPVNLIVMMIILFMGYTVVRAVIEVRAVESKKKVLMDLMLGGAGLGIYVLLVHFFGWIPAVAVPIGCLWAKMEEK